VDRKTPAASDLVRLAVEVSDPDGRDPALGRLEEKLEDDDEPAIAVASTMVVQLAWPGGEASYERDPSELMLLAVRAQWHGDPPSYVADWLGDC
jgi:hypothetical protein